MTSETEGTPETPENAPVTEAAPEPPPLPPAKQKLKPGPKGPRKPKERGRDPAAAVVAAPPEMKVRKDPLEVKDVYAAFDRAYAAEVAQYGYRKGLAERYKAETGRTLAMPPAPVHPLDAQTPAAADSARIPVTKCLPAVKGGLALMGSLMDVETRPTLQTMQDLADALSDLSRHYPEIENKALDWFGVVCAASACLLPMKLERDLKVKKKWTAETRQKFVAKGLIEDSGITVRRVSDDA